MRQQIYALTLRKVHHFMLARGFSTEALLAGTDIKEQDLKNPYYLINENQARIYYRNVVSLQGQESVGLEVGWNSRLSDLGPHGQGLAASRTLNEVIVDAVKNIRFYYLLGEWSAEVHGKTMIFKYLIKEPQERLRIFLLERGIAMVQAHIEELCSTDAKPLKVLLDYPRPENYKRYQEIFCCPVQFNQAMTEVHYPANYLDREVETYDPQTRPVLSMLRDNLLGNLSSRGDIVRDITMALRQQQGEFSSLEEMAGKLAMSSRTLRRKLGAQNTSFQELLDAERRRIAETLLVDTTKSIQQIAEQCGFKDAQNFSTAFKRWQGISPSDFRNSHNE